jgi:uncharacterized protein YdcH (DUF465 family)
MSAIKRPMAVSQTGGATHGSIGTAPPPTTENPRAPLAGSHRTMWMSVAIAAIVIALALAAAFAATTFRAQNASKSLSAAEAHWTAATQELAKLDRSVSDVQNASTGDMAGAVDALGVVAVSASRPIRQQLADAETDVAALKAGSPTRVAYQGAIDKTREGLDELDAATKSLPNLSKLIAASSRLEAQRTEGFDADGAATRAENNEKWDTAISSAKDSVTAYQGALQTVKEMQRLAPDSGLEANAAVAALELKLAQTQLKIARAGKAGNMAAFDSEVKNYSALVTKVNSAIDESDDPDPALMIKGLKQSLLAFKDAMREATRQHDQAITASR